MDIEAVPRIKRAAHSGLIPAGILERLDDLQPTMRTLSVCCRCHIVLPPVLGSAGEVKWKRTPENSPRRLSIDWKQCDGGTQNRCTFLSGPLVLRTGPLASFGTSHFRLENWVLATMAGEQHSPEGTPRTARV